MGLGVLILNLKNYAKVLGDGAVELALEAERVAGRTKVEIIVAPPTPTLALVASCVKVPVFSQSVGPAWGEKSTGAVVPEAVKAAGARGTLMNHSEARMTASEIRKAIPEVHRLGLRVCLCAETTSEVTRFARLGAEFIAIEPPELIGSGVPVSMNRPELVTGAVSAATRAGFRGRILCGAGILSGKDVRRAVELGADGVLVSSSVVGARDWGAKILELAGPLK
ncbi:MAG: triosephosphate isomerase [Thaumarchaeota archaeon]|nr:triosephosphate isomerase [Nitrososphaerota archaeon]